ncbi:MAG TPA: hypothetical protein VEO55_01060, partial [Candidatus Dormibacteraeota bacterium]|nr:hypothetical protein [Candidatus Dormibacteraeota bacterium]
MDQPKYKQITCAGVRQGMTPAPGGPHTKICAAHVFENLIFQTGRRRPAREFFPLTSIADFRRLEVA